MRRPAPADFLLALLLAALSSLLLIVLHGLGEALAGELGPPPRGGVGWGLLVGALLAFWFPLLALLQGLGALCWPLAACSLALFGLPLLLLAAPWGDWSHPHRVIHLLSCAALSLALSCAAQPVLQPCRALRAGGRYMAI